MISLDPADHEIRQEKHYYPFGLHMEHPDFWVDYPEGDRYQYNSIENVSISNALLYAAHYRTLDPSLGRWLQVDPMSEYLYGYSPYNAMLNNPFSFNDPEGDIPPLIIAGLIGAAVGGFGNTIYQATQGNINSWADGFAAFGIGAGAGFVGTVAGAASLVSMGTAGSLGAAIGYGATAGAVGGATGGFIQNTGNALYFQNSNLFEAIGSGLEGAAWGALGGAVVGGIAGGIAYRPNTITGGTNAAATVGDDFVSIRVNGQKIKVPGLEVSASQPSGGLNLQAARQTGLYNGPVTSYSSNVAGTSLQGGLNLYKWGAPQTLKATGWKAGDYMLHLPNRGSPRLNWKANYGALRREMNLGNPIFDSYRFPNGNLIPTSGFLNAERFILQSRGWMYNPVNGAWMPPIR